MDRASWRQWEETRVRSKGASVRLGTRKEESWGRHWMNISASISGGRMDSGRRCWGSWSGGIA